MKKTHKIENPELETIVKEVCSVYGITREDFMGRNRRQLFCDARKMYSYIGRKSGYSWADMGTYIGKDHATIIHHFKVIHQLMQTGDQMIKKRYVMLMNSPVIKRVIETNVYLPTKESVKALETEIQMIRSKFGIEIDVLNDKLENLKKDFSSLINFDR